MVSVETEDERLERDKRADAEVSEVFGVTGAQENVLEKARSES